MDVSAVANVRNMLAIKPRSADLEPPTLFEIEASSRAGDEVYTSSRERPALKRRMNDLEDDEFTLSNDEQSGGYSAAPSRSGGQSRISFFV